MQKSMFHSAAANENTNGNIKPTSNGDTALASTLNAHLDLFGRVGNINKSDSEIQRLFRLALQENPDLAIRLMLHTRDIREGKGRKAVFQDMLDIVLETYGYSNGNITDVVLSMIPEMGYFKDLLNIKSPTLRMVAIRKYMVPAILSGNKLAAKWAPRATGKSKIAKLAPILMHELGLIEDYKMKLRDIDPRALTQYNRLLSDNSETIEQYITRKDWENIRFDHIPSRAFMRHSRTLKKFANEYLQTYLDKVTKGEAKINAGTGALYPHDIAAASDYRSTNYSYRSRKSNVDPRQLNAQFDQLIKDSNIEGKILPMCDISASMYCPTGLRTAGNSIDCMDVSIGLSAFLARSNKGAFGDLVLSFTDVPRFIDLSDKKTAISMFNAIIGTRPGYSTNIDRAIKTILDHAVSNNVDVKDMPTHLVIFSDMQFNPNYSDSRFLNRCKDDFKSAGYEMPQILFWNLSQSAKSAIPVSKYDENIALVSGFDTTILNGIFDGSLNPMNVMLEVLMKDRYQTT